MAKAQLPLLVKKWHYSLINQLLYLGYSAIILESFISSRSR